MEEILKEILEEMRLHTRQNNKIMELLTKLRQPCGNQNQIAGITKLFENMPEEIKKMNPYFGQMIDQIKEMGKEPK
jgi:hypothetical protein